MEQTSELRAAVEGLYEVFAPYVLRDDIDACPCCHSPEDEKRLHRRELRKLRGEDLRQYATDALLVWGELGDYKHFLPRIFELAAMEGDNFLDPSTVFVRLHHGEWRSWPEKEQHTVDQFLDVLWRCVLDSPTHESYGDEIEGWLCGIAQAVNDLAPFLHAWLAMETESARLNLARFIAETQLMSPRHHRTAFWEERAELFDETVAWVRSDAVKAKMTAIAAEYSQLDFVERAFMLIP